MGINIYLKGFKRLAKMVYYNKGIMIYHIKHRGLKAAYNSMLMKIIHRGEHVGAGLIDFFYRAHPSLVPFPYAIEIEITTKCFLRCKMCERTHWKNVDYINTDMSFEKFKRIIDMFPKLKYINVTGEGTSFMNKEYFKMIRYLKSKNIFVVAIDTLAGVDDKFMKKLIKNNIDRLWISMDGATKETYENIRIGAKYERVINNIKRFVELKKEMKSKLPEMGLRYTFFKDNKDELIKFIELAHELGVPEVNFIGLLEFNETKNLVHEPSDEVIAEANKRAKELGVNVIWDHPFHNPDDKQPMEKCASWTEPYIMIDGNVVSCCSVLMSNKRDFLGEHSFGNVYEKDFKDIWNTTRYKRHRLLVPRKDGMVPIYCKDCRGFDTTKREKKYGVSKKI